MPLNLGYQTNIRSDPLVCAVLLWVVLIKSAFNIIQSSQGIEWLIRNNYESMLFRCQSFFKVFPLLHTSSFISILITLKLPLQEIDDICFSIRLAHCKYCFTIIRFDIQVKFTVVFVSESPKPRLWYEMKSLWQGKIYL